MGVFKDKFNNFSDAQLDRGVYALFPIDVYSSAMGSVVIKDTAERFKLFSTSLYLRLYTNIIVYNCINKFEDI